MLLHFTNSLQAPSHIMADYTSDPESLIPAFKLERVLNQGLSILLHQATNEGLILHRPSRTPLRSPRPHSHPTCSSDPRTSTFPYILGLPGADTHYSFNTQEPRRKRCVFLVPGEQLDIYTLCCHFHSSIDRLRRPKAKPHIPMYSFTHQEIQQARRADGHRNTCHLQR